MSAERDKNFHLQERAPTAIGSVIRAARAIGDRDLERTTKAITAGRARHRNQLPRQETGGCHQCVSTPRRPRRS